MTFFPNTVNTYNIYNYIRLVNNWLLQKVIILLKKKKVHKYAKKPEKFAFMFFIPQSYYNTHGNVFIYYIGIFNIK